eukprot:NODE_4738_length_1853_cov_5.231170.p1 GENE.NODE_4738_length_1853_cov_5.231170~~NODE_4738_length_1853_cov_5.231170.p1  ORF type:complete len:595 (+),score=45.81 NODE_4738_length_1853_cov_5.231170:67-1785(+)
MQVTRLVFCKQRFAEAFVKPSMDSSAQAGSSHPAPVLSWAMPKSPAIRADPARSESEDTVPGVQGAVLGESPCKENHRVGASSPDAMVSTKGAHVASGLAVLSCRTRLGENNGFATRQGAARACSSIPKTELVAIPDWIYVQIAGKTPVPTRLEERASDVRTAGGRLAADVESQSTSVAREKVLVVESDLPPEVGLECARIAPESGTDMPSTAGQVAQQMVGDKLPQEHSDASSCAGLCRELPPPHLPFPPPPLSRPSPPRPPQDGPAYGDPAKEDPTENDPTEGDSVDHLVHASPNVPLRELQDDTAALSTGEGETLPDAVVPTVSAGAMISPLLSGSQLSSAGLNNACVPSLDIPHESGELPKQTSRCGGSSPASSSAAQVGQRSVLPYSVWRKRRRAECLLVESSSCSRERSSGLRSVSMCTSRHSSRSMRRIEHESDREGSVERSRSDARWQPTKRKRRRCRSKATGGAGVKQNSSLRTGSGTRPAKQRISCAHSSRCEENGEDKVEEEQDHKEEKDHLRRHRRHSGLCRRGSVKKKKKKKKKKKQQRKKKNKKHQKKKNKNTQYTLR